MVSDEQRITAGGEQIAVIGRAEVVAPFRAAGLKVVPTEADPDAAQRAQELVDAGSRVIFFTEDLMPYLGALLERYRKTPVPCLVSLPMGGGQQGVTRLKEMIKRAVGADIFAR
jgi:vacuolar-type H+-ATPase subunit F/Vma7